MDKMHIGLTFGSFAFFSPHLVSREVNYSWHMKNTRTNICSRLYVSIHAFILNLHWYVLDIPWYILDIHWYIHLHSSHHIAKNTSMSSYIYIYMYICIHTNKPFPGSRAHRDCALLSSLFSLLSLLPRLSLYGYLGGISPCIYTWHPRALINKSHTDSVYYRS
jgi:hypothetical protein